MPALSKPQLVEATGIVLAALCDFRIAATNARFALPEIDVGVPGGCDHAALLPAALALAQEIAPLVSGRMDRRIKPVINQLARTALWDAYDIERLLAIDTMGLR